MKTRELLILGMIFLAMFMIYPSVIAQAVEGAVEQETITVSGFDLEELIVFVAGVIAVALFVITFMAYNRDGRSKFLYVSIAFLLIAVKNFIDSSALFIEEVEIFGSIAVSLELLVMLFFFYALVKKGG